MSAPLGPWLWFAGESPDVDADGRGQYDLAECETRDEAIAQARMVPPSGGHTHFIEARRFQHREEWEAEDDPIRFAETRNHEVVTL